MPDVADLVNFHGLGLGIPGGIDIASILMFAVVSLVSCMANLSSSFVVSSFTMSKRPSPVIFVSCSTSDEWSLLTLFSSPLSYSSMLRGCSTDPVI